MINDPGAWGSSSPRHLVLGFSKGATQAGVYQSGRFEDIAFAGMRPRLTAALQAVGVLASDRDITQEIEDSDGDFGFGSLIRCNVSRKDPKANDAEGESPVYGCTGPIINKSFVEIPHIIERCFNTFLMGALGSSSTVFFLGNGDTYVKRCQTLLVVMSNVP